MAVEWACKSLIQQRNLIYTNFCYITHTACNSHSEYITGSWKCKNADLLHKSDPQSNIQLLFYVGTYNLLNGILCVHSRIDLCAACFWQYQQLLLFWIGRNKRN